MKKFMTNLRTRFSGSKPEYSDDVAMDHEGYVELSHEGISDAKTKVIVRPFVIEDFADVKPVLDATRQGYTICLLNIRPIRDKDLTELRRTVNKLKKTAEAVNGDIAGFGEDWLVMTPDFAQIYRPPKPKQMPQPVQDNESQGAADMADEDEK